MQHYDTIQKCDITIEHYHNSRISYVLSRNVSGCIVAAVKVMQGSGEWQNMGVRVGVNDCYHIRSKYCNIHNKKDKMLYFVSNIQDRNLTFTHYYYTLLYLDH